MNSRTYNQVVQCAEASTPSGIETLFGDLPSVVRRKVIVELQERCTAQHYDSGSGHAYFFTRLGTELVVWTWRCLTSIDEAGRLLSKLNSLPGTLNAETASSLYERAIGRSVTEPHLSDSYC